MPRRRALIQKQLKKIKDRVQKKQKSLDKAYELALEAKELEQAKTWQERKRRESDSEAEARKKNASLEEIKRLVESSDFQALSDAFDQTARDLGVYVDQKHTTFSQKNTLKSLV